MLSRNIRNVSLIFFPIIAIITFGILMKTSSKKNTAGGETIEWKNLPDAIKSARESKKKILIDVFTAWCTGCKKMDKDVYANENVKAYLSEYFELVKLNAESETIHEFRDGKYSEKQIASAFGVDGYPTTLFLTTDAEMITSVPGYLPPKTFSAVLEFIRNEDYKTTTWEEFSRRKGVE